MAHQRRYFPSGRPYFISNRLAEGLPFVANAYINQMLLGIIARARFRHRNSITICAFLFLGNHYHMIVVLNGDPNELAAFMHYIDGEIAKLVVRWLGKRNCRVWGQRYCPAILLTSNSVLKQMIYTFTNPVEASLSATAAQWTGCSSYSALFDKTPKAYKWIKPSLAPLLPNGRFSKSLLKSLLADIKEADAPTYELPIDPFAWLKCFPDTESVTEEEMKTRLVDELDRIGVRCAQERKVEKRTVADPRLLAEQNPHKPYKPKKYSRRVFCISTCKELRKAYIELYKGLCAVAEAAWRLAVNKLEPLSVPHGMFHPPRPAVGSVISMAGFF